MPDPLARVKRATRARERALKALAVANEPWREAIREAVADGGSLRAVGKAAGVSNVRVLQIVRGE